jgi:hypothetical protein
MEETPLVSLEMMVHLLVCCFYGSVLSEWTNSMTVLQPCIQWDNAEDDEAVKSANDRFMEKALALAKETGVHHP